MYFLTALGCLLAASMTLLICVNARPISTKLGLSDKPDGVRKLHNGAVPLMGGLAVAAPALILALAYLLWVQAGWPLIVAVCSLGVVVLIGAIDDRVGLPAGRRLLALSGVIAVACLVEPAFVLHNLRLDFIDADIAFGPFALLITVFIVVGFVNASNLADGINGQLLGSIAIWCGFILLYAPDERTPMLVLLSSTLVALAFNLRSKLFSGSAGSYTLPLFIGLTTIALYRKSDGAFSAELPVYWFWLPVLDCLRLFAWRLLAGRSPFAADRSHIHHILDRLVGRKFALPAYLGLLALPGVAAIVNEKAGLAALLVCACVYLVILVVEKGRRTASAYLKPEKA